MVIDGDSIDAVEVAIIDASFETTMVTIVDGVLLATIVLTIGRDSAMIVIEGRATDYCSTIICFKDLVKYRIEDSIMDVEMPSKIERLDNVTYF